MDAGLLYRNAVIKSREATLLSAERLQRISDAASIEEAVRLLYEAGYPSGTSYDEILLSAEREAAQFFKSCLTAGYGLELFLVADDYHNAKVAAKAHYLGAAKEAYKPEGFLPYAVIESALEKQEYAELPQAMADAFLFLDKRKAKDDLYPSEADIELDKAAFRDICAREKGVSKIVKTYFSTLADLKNISIAYRAGKAGFSREKAEKMLLPAGEIDVKDLMKIYSFGEEAADKIRVNRLVSDALDAIKVGTATYEVYMEDTLLRLLKRERYDMFSPAPIAGYYVGKLREIKNIRLILARIANGADKEIIRKRMRELYV